MPFQPTDPRHEVTLRLPFIASPADARQLALKLNHLWRPIHDQGEVDVAAAIVILAHRLLVYSAELAHADDLEAERFAAELPDDLGGLLDA